MEDFIYNTLHQVFANFPKVLGVRMVARSKFHTNGPLILGATGQNLICLSLLIRLVTVLIIANARITCNQHHNDHDSCVTKCTGNRRAKNWTLANVEIIRDLNF